MAIENRNPEEIFHRAVEITARSERAAYLAEAYQGVKALLAETEQLTQGRPIAI
jgi:hypothetical protein